MIGGLDYLRELDFISPVLRLTLAMLFGGMIGTEREFKRRSAGFRTYMLVCLGSALTSIMSHYLFILLDTVWAGIVATTGKQIVVSRLGATICTVFLRRCYAEGTSPKNAKLPCGRAGHTAGEKKGFTCQRGR